MASTERWRLWQKFSRRRHRLGTDPVLSSTLIGMVMAWHEGKGGTVITNSVDRNSCIAVEYMEAMALSGIPMVAIDFVISPSLQRGRAFLRGEQFTEVFVNANQFAALKTHLTRGSRLSGNIDVGAGCPLLRGHISPVILSR
jgi:hypothetical protein